jgi:hypothetical protein
MSSTGPPTLSCGLTRGTHGNRLCCKYALKRWDADTSLHIQHSTERVLSDLTMTPPPTDVWAAIEPLTGEPEPWMWHPQASDDYPFNVGPLVHAKESTQMINWNSLLDSHVRTYLFDYDLTKYKNCQQAEWYMPSDITSSAPHLSVVTPIAVVAAPAPDVIAFITPVHSSVQISYAAPVPISIPAPAPAFVRANAPTTTSIPISVPARVPGPTPTHAPDIFFVPTSTPAGVPTHASAHVYDPVPRLHNPDLTRVATFSCVATQENSPVPVPTSARIRASIRAHPTVLCPIDFTPAVITAPVPTPSGWTDFRAATSSIPTTPGRTFTGFGGMTDPDVWAETSLRSLKRKADRAGGANPDSDPRKRARASIAPNHSFGVASTCATAEVVGAAQNNQLLTSTTHKPVGSADRLEGYPQSVHSLATGPQNPQTSAANRDNIVVHEVADGRWACSIPSCGFTSKHNQNVKRHIKEKHSLSRLYCNLCKEWISRKGSVPRHVKSQKHQDRKAGIPLPDYFHRGAGRPSKEGERARVIGEEVVRHEDGGDGWIVVRF